MSNYSYPRSHSDLVRFFEKNKRLAGGTIKRIAHYFPTADPDDMLALAYLGLWKACLAFDPTRGFAFSTCATKYISGEINAVFGKRKRSRTLQTLSLDAPIEGTEGVTLADLAVAPLSCDPHAILTHRLNLDEARETWQAMYPSIKARKVSLCADVAAFFGSSV